MKENKRKLRYVSSEERGLYVTISFRKTFGFRLEPYQYDSEWFLLHFDSRQFVTKPIICNLKEFG